MECVACLVTRSGSCFETYELGKLAVAPDQMRRRLLINEMDYCRDQIVLSADGSEARDRRPNKNLSRTGRSNP